MVTNPTKVNIYCDGGLIRNSPSRYGGVYAWICERVGLIWEDGTPALSRGMGWVWSKDIEILGSPLVRRISCNYIEAFAICEGISEFCKHADKDEPTEVTVISDSRNGLLWAASPECKPPEIMGVPYGDRYNYPTLMESIGFAEELMQREDGITWKKMLCKGHPTQKEFDQGFSDRASHRPVYELQHQCHKRCEFLADILGECCDYGPYDGIDRVSQSVFSELEERMRKYEERRTKATGSRQRTNVRGSVHDAGKAVHALISLGTTPGTVRSDVQEPVPS